MKMVEPRTFRATTEAWVGQLLLPVCFFVLLAITAVNAAGLSPAIAGFGLVLLFVVFAFDYLLPMLRNWLYLDGNTIEGSLNGRYFHVYWSEIKAAWLYDQWRGRFVCLGTSDNTLVIPLRFFDESAVWERVQGAVPPSALESNAMQRLPGYQDWMSARTAFLEDPTPRQVADHWLVQIIGWTGVSYFGYGAIQCLREDGLVLALVQLVLALLSLAALSGWGITEVGPQQVCRYTMAGRWAISWEEVRWIEMDLFDAVIVLGSDDRRLMIPGPCVWNRFGKKEAMALLLAQAEQRCIPLRRSILAMFKGSRNTRKRKNSENKS